MKKSSLVALAALAMAGGLASQPPTATAEARQGASAGSQKAERQTGDTQRTAATDTRTSGLRFGRYGRRTGAPRGKRYSASVKQHQRHAAKARRKAKAR